MMVLVTVDMLMINDHGFGNQHGLPLRMPLTMTMTVLMVIFSRMEMSMAMILIQW